MLSLYFEVMFPRKVKGSRYRNILCTDMRLLDVSCEVWKWKEKNSNLERYQSRILFHSLSNNKSISLRDEEYLFKQILLLSSIRGRMSNGSQRGPNWPYLTKADKLSDLFRWNLIVWLLYSYLKMSFCGEFESNRTNRFQ